MKKGKWPNHPHEIASVLRKAMFIRQLRHSRPQFIVESSFRARPDGGAGFANDFSSDFPLLSLPQPTRRRSRVWFSRNVRQMFSCPAYRLLSEPRGRKSHPSRCENPLPPLEPQPGLQMAKMTLVFANISAFPPQSRSPPRRRQITAVTRCHLVLNRAIILMEIHRGHKP